MAVDLLKVAVAAIESGTPLTSDSFSQRSSINEATHRNSATSSSRVWRPCFRFPSLMYHLASIHATPHPQAAALDCDWTVDYIAFRHECWRLLFEKQWGPLLCILSRLEQHPLVTERNAMGWITFNCGKKTAYSGWKIIHLLLYFSVFGRTHNEMQCNLCFAINYGVISAHQYGKANIDMYCISLCGYSDCISISHWKSSIIKMPWLNSILVNKAWNITNGKDF